MRCQSTRRRGRKSGFARSLSGSYFPKPLHLGSSQIGALKLCLRLPCFLCKHSADVEKYNRFKNSPEYRNFQQQVQRSTSERLSVHSETDTSSTSLPSAQSSDEKGGEGSWRRGGRPAETPRDPVRIGSFIVHFPREDWHQDTNASGTKGKTSPLDAPPPTGSQASRNIYRPPGSRMPSSGTVVSTIKGRTSHVWRARRDNHRPAGSNLSYHGNGSRAANKERSRTKDEEPSEGEGRRGHEVMTIKSESGSQ